MEEWDEAKNLETFVLSSNDPLLVTSRTCCITSMFMAWNFVAVTVLSGRQFKMGNNIKTLNLYRLAFSSKEPFL